MERVLGEEKKKSDGVVGEGCVGVKAIGRCVGYVRVCACGG